MCQKQNRERKRASPAGFEPALPEGNALAGRRVNHSTKVTSCQVNCNLVHKEH